MLKLVILLSFATVLYGYDWSDDVYVTGVVGSLVDVAGCQAKADGKCSSATPCCSPRVCWIDGICREKLPKLLSIEGLEYVTGKVGQYQRYDGCNNDRKRLGEACNKTEDCCFPLDCGSISGQCTGDIQMDTILGILSSGWSIPLKPGL